MNCDNARDSMILAAYGEMPDQDAIALEQHLDVCPECADEFAAIRAMDVSLAHNPIVDIDANLLAQSRMRLDEALDALPQHGFLTRLQASAAAWLGHLQGAPALATLLVGVGFLGGNFTYRYQVAHAPVKMPPTILSNQAGGGISTISAISQLPGDQVQVSYSRIVPETMQGSLDDPQIRQLLMMGMRAEGDSGVRVNSVSLLADECRIGHSCRNESDGTGIRSALLYTLRTDRNPSSRLKALDGLQPYVAQDESVRDAVAQTLLIDTSSAVRTRAVSLLQPVRSDSTVRQVLRTVSTSDDNPYIRTVSFETLQRSRVQ